MKSFFRVSSVIIGIIVLVFSIGCRSGGEKSAYWKADTSADRRAKTMQPKRGAFKPERVTRPSKKKQGGGLPSLQVQVGSPEGRNLAESPGGFRSTGAYRLKPGDGLLVRLSGPVETQIEDILDEEGNLNLTYIGTVHASGKTTTQLEREIERLYLDEKIYKQLSVNVVVPTKNYFIRGNVRVANRYPLIGRVTLMQAIAAAGGFNEFANPKKITITRGNETRVVDFNAIQKNPSLDVELLPGDSVFVPRGIF